jgi:hypothetical protein
MSQVFHRRLVHDCAVAAAGGASAIPALELEAATATAMRAAA